MTATPIIIHFTTSEVETIQKAAKKAAKKFNQEIVDSEIRRILKQQGMVTEVKHAIAQMESR